MVKKRLKIHQHDVSTFVECRKKFDLSFNQHIYPRKISKALHIGDLFAKSVYWLHKNKSIEECLAWIHAESEKLKLQAINKIILMK